MLDERNGFKPMKSPSLHIDYILKYTKQVEDKHLRLKRICNRFFTLGIVLFLLLILVLFIERVLFPSVIS
jgi:hypothetical protein